MQSHTPQIPKKELFLVDAFMDEQDNHREKVVAPSLSTKIMQVRLSNTGATQARCLHLPIGTSIISVRIDICIHFKQRK
jgi:hypothetical protein